jgi:SAM-dependent methyltransferase
VADDVALNTLRRFMRKHPSRNGRTLVVGSKCYGDKPDRRAHYKKAFGVDLFEGEGVDLVHDMEKPLPDSLGQFDHVDCVSVLEHVRRPWKMAENIERALVHNGTILVSVPFSWRLHGYPSDLWRMSAEALTVLFPSIQWRERKYLVGDRLRNLVPGKTDTQGKWIARSELVAAGVKCA